jgi:hypothetical protein
MINRTKALVLALFAFYWAAVVAILVAARDVYHQILNQALQVGNLPISSQRPAELSVLLVLTALLLLLTAGVIRSWRWTFWLILIVFFAEILHVVTSALQLAGVVPGQGPAWYVLFQAVIGLTQFVIALAMLVGYRKAGVWGAF